MKKIASGELEVFLRKHKLWLIGDHFITRQETVDY